RRLHVGKSRDDDAPDAFGRVKRQVAAMPLHQAPHHLGLARRTERRADLLGLLHLDQGVDDLAALEQQLVHRRVDAIDLAPQIGERGDLVAFRFRHWWPFGNFGRLIGAVRPESKENVDSAGRGPIYATLIARPRAKMPRIQEETGKASRREAPMTEA